MPSLTIGLLQVSQIRLAKALPTPFCPLHLHHNVGPSSRISQIQSGHLCPEIEKVIFGPVLKSYFIKYCAVPPTKDTKGVNALHMATIRASVSALLPLSKLCFSFPRFCPRVITDVCRQLASPPTALPNEMISKLKLCILVCPRRPLGKDQQL